MQPIKGDHIPNFTTFTILVENEIYSMKGSPFIYTVYANCAKVYIFQPFH